MYCIRVGRYWLGRDKEEYLPPSILSVEKYVLTNQDESGVTLRFEDCEKAEMVLEDYLLLNPHCRNLAKIKYKPEIGFE